MIPAANVVTENLHEHQAMVYRCAETAVIFQTLPKAGNRELALTSKSVWELSQAPSEHVLCARLAVVSSIPK